MKLEIVKKITREEFFNIKEENVMFITNPGRMGDEDGSTFIVKDEDKLIVYRISGWMYGNKNNEDYISISEMFKQFPKWEDVCKHWNDDKYDGKYVYKYMGFGNGLAIDKSIYKDYEPYLLEEIKKIKDNSHEKKENSSMYYSAWQPALENMINNI